MSLGIAAPGRLGRLGPPLAALALSGSLACGGTPRIEIERTEAKRSPALVGVCAVFMRIANPGDGADALLGARAELPGTVTQLHAMRDGRMIESDRLVVPARGALELRAGGPHIMVFHLPEGAGAACELALVLRFERSGERRTSVRMQGPSCG